MAMRQDVTMSISERDKPQEGRAWRGRQKRRQTPKYVTHNSEANFCFELQIKAKRKVNKRYHANICCAKKYFR